jgi:hypothetical protein
MTPPATEGTFYERQIKMRVDLRTLQPNPMRDFTIDPMDPEAVERLRQSIAEDGFWGGVVCRQLPDGTLQIAAGHHRVMAALGAGITEADLFVATDMDDRAMIRVYASENATQRGQSSTALTGSVASAMKYVAKCILTGTGFAGELSRKFDMRYVRSRLLSDDGMGWRVLLAFLDNIPGINEIAVKHQLANLKYSGDYARLITEVQEEIAQEQADAEAQALARQAAEQAAKHPKTFDFHGVARHLKNPHQVDVFRTEVTKPAIQQHLPLDQQAPLAARLVAHARERGRHVSGEFIRDEITRILLEEQGDFLAFIRREQQRLEEADEAYALERTLGRLGTHIRGLDRAGRRIAQLMQDWPAGKEVPSIPYELRMELYDTVQTLTALSHDRRFAYEPEDPMGASQSQPRAQIRAPRRRLCAPVHAS